MVKVCEKDFPKGTFPGQQSDGYMMDGYMKASLDIMAEKIADDMQFVGVISGKGTVRNGKSTLAQQHGYYFNHKVNEIHGTNNEFTVNNIIFKADDLIEKAFSLPKYSVLILDEGDDLTAQYYSKLAIKLRRFFRKCGQLNMFFILLIPDFFELPRSYAVTRSTYLVNVMFAGKFQRGFFEFYSGEGKRKLYYKGRRYGDYDCVRADFIGRFPKPYLVDEIEYRSKKKVDMLSDDDSTSTLMTRKADYLIRYKDLKKMNEMKESNTTQEEYSQILNVSKRSITRYEQELSKEKPILAIDSGHI